MQKQFKTFEPGPALRPYIERYWMLEFDHPGLPAPMIKVLPYGHPEFVFHYGDPFRLYDNLKKTVPHAELRALVGGQRKKHVYLQPTGKTGFFAVRFRPAGLFRLMGGPMNELTEQSLSLEEVYGALVHSLIDAIWNATDFENRVDIAEHFFGQQLLRREDKVVYAHHAARYVRENGGQVTVAELCRKLGIGERQVEREFKEKIGITPKYFIRISRLDNAFKMLRQHPSLGWAELAYECGYADQAHFINEFRSLGGESPTQHFARYAEFSAVYQGV